MKKFLSSLSLGFEILGIIYFILRSAVSSVSPTEPFARDIFGFPLLDPIQDVSLEIWIQFLIGGAIPFLLFFSGIAIQKLIIKDDNKLNL